jgi:hypothetical protein
MIGTNYLLVSVTCWFVSYITSHSNDQSLIRLLMGTGPNRVWSLSTEKGNSFLFSRYCSPCKSLCKKPKQVLFHQSRITQCAAVLWVPSSLLPLPADDDLAPESSGR